jgi:hypothetical protein
LDFDATGMDPKVKIEKKDPRVIGHCEACRCGEYEVFRVPEDYRIVGLYGLTATDKYNWDEGKIRELDHIRALGFICMSSKD